MDETGRRKVDRSCTGPFFDVAGRRHEKEGPNTMIPASNAVASDWPKFLVGSGTLPRAQ